MSYSSPSAATVTFEDPEPNTQQVVGDAAKVDALILGLARRCYEHAKEQCQERLSKIEAVDAALDGTTGKTVSNQEQMKLLYQKFSLPEVKTKCDAMAAVMGEALVQGGTVFRAMAQNGAWQGQADSLTAIMTEELDYRNFEDELEIVLNQYQRYPAGVKVCIEDSLDNSWARESVPVDDVEESETPPEDASMPIGDVPSELGSGSQAIPFLTHQGSRNRRCLFIRAVDPRRVVFFDNVRSVQKQTSVHELHYLTAEEIEDQLHATVDPKIVSASQTNAGTTDFPRFEVVESWVELLFERWMKTNACGIEDLAEWAKVRGQRLMDMFQRQKWQVFHINAEAGQLLTVNPTYLLRKLGHPYHMGSGFPPVKTTFGDSLAERVLVLQALLEFLINSYADNLRRNLNQSRIVDTSTALDAGKLRQLDEPNGTVMTKGQINVRDLIYFHQVPDLTATILQAVGIVRDLLNTYGVSQELMGTGNARTATESQGNQARSQQRANSMDRRFKRQIVKPSLQDLRDLVFRFITPGEMVYRLGADAASLATTHYTDPLQIADRFDIQLSGSSKIGQEQQKAQLLLGLMNVAMPVLVSPQPPKAAIAMLEMVLQHMGLTEHEIADYLGQAPDSPTIPQQIDAMAIDPNLSLVQEVRESDNHGLAIQLLNTKAQLLPEFGNQPNVLAYFEKHAAFLDAQMQQATMMQQALPGPGGSASPSPGNPSAPARGDNLQAGHGMARAGGQNVSPPDQGIETAAGLTGKGSLPQV